MNNELKIEMSRRREVIAWWIVALCGIGVVVAVVGAFAHSTGFTVAALPLIAAGVAVSFTEDYLRRGLMREVWR